MKQHKAIAVLQPSPQYWGAVRRVLREVRPARPAACDLCTLPRAAMSAKHRRALLGQATLTLCGECRAAVRMTAPREPSYGDH